MNSLWISEAIFWILMNDVVNGRMPDGCKSRNLSVTADDRIVRLFIDGREMTDLKSTSNWQYPDTLDLPCNARVIAIEGNDKGGVGGISASTDDGYIISNTSWKCSNARIQGWQEVDFNDSSWEKAVNISYHNSFPEATKNIIRGDASWIWTQGYEGQDLNVFCRLTLDVDDCLFGQPINECDPSMGRCIRLPAQGYNCSCYPGYQNDGQHKCNDVDECLRESSENKCNASSGNCMNTPGSYKCCCYEGFANVGDERCEDVDECQLGSPENKCNASSGNCMNTPGSYKCRCYEGFSNVGDERCEDVDECLLGSPENKCNASSGNCTNTPGSYKCRCYEGFANVGDQRCEGSSNNAAVLNLGLILGVSLGVSFLIVVAFVVALSVLCSRKSTSKDQGQSDVNTYVNQSEIVPRTGDILTNKSHPEETYTHLTLNALRSNQNDIYEKIIK